MKGFKETRIVLTEETHAAFKAVSAANEKSMRTVIIELIEQYIRKGGK